MKTEEWLVMPIKTKEQERIEQKTQDLLNCVQSLDGLRRELAEDMLNNYMDVYKDYIKLNKQLKKDGLFITVEKGGANNKHSELQKHPAFDMRRNCISQMADLANKIVKFVNDGEPEPEDEFDAYLNE